MPKENVENCLFSIMVDNSLTDYDRRTLTYLYLPIIGDKAMNIYSTLYSMVNLGQNESEVLNHLQLLSLLHLTGKQFILERKKLEAVGLLATYFKDNYYIYVVKKVLTPYEFFNDASLTRVFTSIMGEELATKTAYDFLIRKVDPSKFENISSSFDEVYEFAGTDTLNQYGELGVDTRNNGITIKNGDFNLEHFLLLVEARGYLNKDLLVSSEFTDQVIRYAFLYCLTVEEMEQAVMGAITEGGNINYGDLALQAKILYDAKKQNKKAVVRKNVVTSGDKQIEALETISPNNIVRAKFKTDLTSSEIEMFDRLLKETGIPLGVLNVLIIYVVSEKNGQIPTYNYFLKIVNTWIRAGVHTTKEAIAYINGALPNQTTNKPRKNTKTVKDTPEWYKKQDQEKKPEQKSDELIDIEDFFADKKGEENE